MQPDRSVVAFPQELDDPRYRQDRDQQHDHLACALLGTPRCDQQGQDESRQGREQQAPFDQPAEGEDRTDDGDTPPVRTVEPKSCQGHRGEDEHVARHDVFADHRQQEHEAASEMEHRGERGDPRAAGQAMDERIDDGRADAGPESVEIGELLPRHAPQDAERVEQPRAHAVEREEEIVRRVEARGRWRGNPGLGLDALVHAVGADDVDVLQPPDQAAQHQQGQREGKQKLPGRRRPCH